MKPIRTFTVVPSLPAPLERLRDVAYNLRWAWTHDAVALFHRLDSDLWERSGHNPVLMLGTIDQQKLAEAAADEAFVAHLDRVANELSSYVAAESTWFRHTHGPPNGPLVAYFSAEFGLTECLSIFAGGMGVLAGDHLKSASDLGVPLVGVGLLYQQGYFKQYLNEAGWQQEARVENDFHNLPARLERRPDGAPLAIEVPYPGRPVLAQVWRAQVGRVRLYLLDTNVSTNSAENREITHQLYGGDVEMRLKQEIMLGIGGYRALEALGLEPSVYHMNEGHSAFLTLERVRRLMEVHGLSFAQARAAASAGLVFTTHTPVPAGHDYFAPELMLRYLGPYAEGLGLSHQEFLGLGRQDPGNQGEAFCMTVLALRLASHCNAVSELHGRVSRRMWQGLWPGVPEDEVPIDHLTNGIHMGSWISHEIYQLYDRYLGPRWREEPADRVVWQGVQRIPVEELWRTHERRRERLVAFVRRSLRAQLERSGAPRAEIEAANEVLDPEALTIGFARRFATYKRATLVLRDPERLAKLLNDRDRPVQFIFAGKAHPRDEAGKELIQKIVALSRQEPFRRRLVFLEDYDTAIARYLVQGADVWLNTPRPPLEASGTSGMKAVANGVLHLSTLDGWWAEGWEGANSHEPIGWAIGRGEPYEDPAFQDQVESEALCGLLEQDVVPTFYDRRADGLPRRWVARMKASIANLCVFFNTHRMVREYVERFYQPAAERYQQLTANGVSEARALAAWNARVAGNWPRVRVEAVESDLGPELRIGDALRARALVHLGGLTPAEVRVELYYGPLDANGEIAQAATVTMQPLEQQGEDGPYLFETDAVTCRKSGSHGFSVRVLPHHPCLSTRFLPGLIAWAEAERPRARHGLRA